MGAKFMLDVGKLISERTSYPTIYDDYPKSFGQMYIATYSWPQNVHHHLGKEHGALVILVMPPCVVSVLMHTVFDPIELLELINSWTF